MCIWCPPCILTDSFPEKAKLHSHSLRESLRETSSPRLLWGIPGLTRWKGWRSMAWYDWLKRCISIHDWKTKFLRHATYFLVSVMWHPNLGAMAMWRCVQLSAGVTLQQAVANRRIAMENLEVCEPILAHGKSAERLWQDPFSWETRAKKPPKHVPKHQSNFEGNLLDCVCWPVGTQEC